MTDEKTRAAPTWITDAVEAACVSVHRLRDTDPDLIAYELSTRIPIGDMTRAVRRVLYETPNGEPIVEHADQVVRTIVEAMFSEPDALDMTRCYQDCSRQLDKAGVPYGVNTAPIYKNFDMPDRIAWLIGERPFGTEVRYLRVALAAAEATIGQLRVELRRMTALATAWDLGGEG